MNCRCCWLLIWFMLVKLNNEIFRFWDLWATHNFASYYFKFNKTKNILRRLFLFLFLAIQSIHTFICHYEKERKKERKREQNWVSFECLSWLLIFLARWSVLFRSFPVKLCTTHRKGLRLEKCRRGKTETTKSEKRNINWCNQHSSIFLKRLFDNQR